MQWLKDDKTCFEGLQKANTPTDAHIFDGQDGTNKRLVACIKDGAAGFGAKPDAGIIWHNRILASSMDPTGLGRLWGRTHVCSSAQILTASTVGQTIINHIRIETGI